jgi:hypothetical protein
VSTNSEESYTYLDSESENEVNDCSLCDTVVNDDNGQGNIICTGSCNVKL